MTLWIAVTLIVSLFAGFVWWFRAQSCEACGESYFSEVGCLVTAYDFADGPWPRIPVQDDLCTWCLAPAGQLHHVDCENETCPRCGELRFECRCFRYWIPPAIPREVLHV